MDAAKSSPHDIELNASTSTPSLPVRVVNPYAVNRTSKSSKASRNDTASSSSFIHEAESPARTLSDGPPTAKEPSSRHILPDEPRNEIDTSHEPQNTAVEESMKQNAASDTGAAQRDGDKASVATPETTKPVSFGNLPPWQRLPSQNVSFGAAEILTVSELRKHGSLYMGRSVRITGVLLCRHLLDQDQLAIVVGDPMAGARPMPIRRRNPYNAAKTPLLKRKVVVRTPATNLKSAGKTPLLGRKRHLLSTPKQPPTSVDSVVSFLFEQPSVLVLANPTHVQTNNVAVGDLVMMIGEVFAIDAANVVASSTQPLVDQVLKRQGNEEANSVQYLQARILGNANGTDMRLHGEALVLRRRHVLQHTKTQGSNDTLLLGCGPPPYNPSD